MNRQMLLEMCLVSLLSLPNGDLEKLLPTLAALAEPHLAVRADRDDLQQRVQECLSHILDSTAGHG